MPRLAIWVDTGGDGEALDACCTVAASLVDAATPTGAGIRLGAWTAAGPTWATRLRAIDLHRLLARLQPADEAPYALDAKALRGVGTLVLVVPEIRAGLDADLAGVLPAVGRAVVIAAGGEEPFPSDPIVRALLATGADVVPWIADHGLGEPLVRPVEVPV
jgi:hypothetical protein